MNKRRGAARTWPAGRVLRVEYPNRVMTVEQSGPGRYWVRAVQERNGLTWAFGCRTVAECRRTVRYMGRLGYVYGDGSAAPYGRWGR